MLNLSKIKKVLFGFIGVLLLVFSLSACSNDDLNNVGDVYDLVGRKISVKKEPYKRVVCIGAGALRLYSYVGDVNSLCGVEDIDNDSLSNRPKMFDGVARPYFLANKDVFNKLASCGVGGPQSQIIETEKILNCNPDIIISEYEDIEKANKLQNDVNVPVVVVSYGSEGVFDTKLGQSLSLLGKIFNKVERAKAINDFIKTEREKIEAKCANINVSTQKKVYVMGLGNWGTTDHLMTAQNYTPFRIARINNIVTDLAKDGIQKIEAEKFEALAPNMDIMIMDAAAVKNIKKLYITNPNLFDNCKAWNNGEVYLQMAYNAYYTNIEIALCNTWFNAKVVYPELFSDVDINTKLNEITKVFLGKELANEINAYPMSYGGYGKVNKETIFA